MTTKKVVITLDIDEANKDYVQCPYCGETPPDYHDDFDSYKIIFFKCHSCGGEFDAKKIEAYRINKIKKGEGK